MLLNSITEFEETANSGNPLFFTSQYHAVLQ